MSHPLKRENSALADLSSLEDFSAISPPSKRIAVDLPKDAAEKKRVLFHLWNEETALAAPALFHDETLRDGLQAPSAVNPTPQEKCQMLDFSSLVGCQSACIGFPASSVRNFADCTTCFEHIRDAQLPLMGNVICRTVMADVEETIRLHRSTGCDMETLLFLGTSPIRMIVEDWNVKKMESSVRDTVRRTVQDGMRVVMATEDTTRSTPDMLDRIFGAAIEEGADVICIADTVGYITPQGVGNQVRYLQDLIKRKKPSKPVTIDFHGHSDRGMSLANSLAALQMGCRVHGAILGLGERSGNAPLDQILVNHFLDQEYYGQHSSLGHKFENLTKYVNLVSKATCTPIPTKYPVFAEDSFATMTGIHAAAVLKAEVMGDHDLADVVYSAVPARSFGLSQKIIIGPDSGHWNVDVWLLQHKIPITPKAVNLILDYVKQKRRIISDEECFTVLEEVIGKAGTGIPQDFVRTPAQTPEPKSIALH